MQRETNIFFLIFSFSFTLSWGSISKKHIFLSESSENHGDNIIPEVPVLRGMHIEMIIYIPRWGPIEWALRDVTNVNDLLFGVLALKFVRALLIILILRNFIAFMRAFTPGSYARSYVCGDRRHCPSQSERAPTRSYWTYATRRPPVCRTHSTCLSVNFDPTSRA